MAGTRRRSRSDAPACKFFKEGDKDKKGKDNKGKDKRHGTDKQWSIKPPKSEPSRGRKSLSVWERCPATCACAGSICTCPVGLHERSHFLVLPIGEVNNGRSGQFRFPQAVSSPRSSHPTRKRVGALFGIRVQRLRGSSDRHGTPSRLRLLLAVQFEHGYPCIRVGSVPESRATEAQEEGVCVCIYNGILKPPLVCGSEEHH